MRIISESVRDWLNRDRGIEPQLIVGVKWSDDQEVFYTSHDIPGAHKNVVSITGVNTTVNVNNTSGNQSATVTLSDTDGELTKIINTIDPYKKVAHIYLHFPGVPIDQALSIVEGEINSPVTWDDAARTLEFTILSRIEGRRFGFSTEEGRFRLIESAARSDAWPFRFGSTCHYPATKVQTGVKGFLREGQGVLDPTIATRICQVRQIKCPDVFVNIYDGTVYYTREDMDNFLRDLAASRPVAVQYNYLFQQSSTRFGGSTAEMQNAWYAYTEGHSIWPGKEPECLAAKSSLLCQLMRDEADQSPYISDTLVVAGGHRFPQNVKITLRVKDVRYVGVMDGETFTISETLRDDVQLNSPCGPVPEFSFGYRRARDDNPTSVGNCERDPIYPTRDGDLAETKMHQIGVAKHYVKSPVGGAGAGFRVVQEGRAVGFKWFPAGTDVFLEQSSKIIQVVSAVPGTVTQVAAYRTFGDNKILTVVPPDRYEVFFTVYGDLQVVELHLPKEMSDYSDEEGGNEKWDDELFVSFVSDVGPNPTNVIKWIAETFTDLTVDLANFAAVSAKLTNYPCNAFLDTREDALQVISQIAREARCAARVTAGVLSLVYLPETPDSLRTLTTSDVVNATVRSDITSSESVNTAHKVLYKEAGATPVKADRVEQSFTVQRNVDKYGYSERSETYDTINNEEQALKTATFWSIRESNVYRRVTFQTTLQHLDLEVFDCVTLDLGIFPETKILIESMQYDPSSSLLQFSGWTPILAGTVEEYFWAWPAGKPAAIPYPTSVYELEDPRLNIFPPEGHPLHVSGPDPAAQATLGDRFPSDLDDEFPVTNCRIATDYVLVDEIQPQFDRPDRDFSALAARMDQVNTGLGGGSLGDDGEIEDLEVEGCGALLNGTDCTYYVLLTYITPQLIATQIGVNGCLSAGPCVSKVEDQLMQGLVCSGPLDQECKTFANLQAANSYWVARYNEANNNKKTCAYNLFERKLISATAPAVAFSKNSSGQVCSGDNDPDITEEVYKTGSGGVGST